jgi:hypothetical protein
VDGVPDLVKGLSERIRLRHQKILEGGGLIGAPFPYDILNDKTGGMSPGDVYLFYGIPKSMKTWVALYFLLWAYIMTEARVLIYTPEMNVEDIAVRTACILARTPYDWADRGFPEGREEEAIEFFATLNAIEEKEDIERKMGQRLILTTGDLTLQPGGALRIFEDKIYTYEPRIIFVDSAYMLTSDRDWKVVSKFLGALKKLANRTGVIFIITSQENIKDAMKAAFAGKNPGQSTTSFTQAFTEICDLAFRIIKKSRGLDHLGFLLSLWNVAGRKLTIDGFTIRANPGHDFGYHDSKLIRMEDTVETSKRSEQPRRQPTTGVRVVDRLNSWDPASSMGDKT